MFTEAGLNEAATPVGMPLAVRLMDCALPVVSAVLTVAVAELPACAVPEEGDTAIEKSFAGGGGEVPQLDGVLPRSLTTSLNSTGLSTTS